MASKGKFTQPPQWWKHLRDWKKVFWSKERKAAKRDAKKQARDD